MRKPDFVIDDERKELFIKKLKPIVNWRLISKGEKIFHKNTNKITMADTLDNVDIENGIVTYINDEGITYSYGLSGWYIYDYEAAYSVLEETRPKLYKFKDKLIIAENTKDLFNIIKNKTELIDANYTFFTEEQLENVELIEFIDGYEIELK